TVEMDSRGYRGPELPDAPPVRGVYRVLCVGDSITFGFNVDQGAAYARQLDAALRTAYPGRRFEVINAGVPGWSWVQGRRFLEVEGMALHPDVVVIGHGTNDQFYIAEVTDRESMERLESPIAHGMRALIPFLMQTNTYRAILKLSPTVRARVATSP